MPVTSGSEIISNPGNAALGYSSGVAYGGNPADVNPLAGVDSTLGKLQDEEAQFQVLKYQRRLKDQDDLANMLAQTGGSLFNAPSPGGTNMSFTPLPEDKKILDQKADELRKEIISNPQGYKFDSGILQQQQELNALKNHASERVRFATDAKMEASKTNDQEDRQGMLDNLNQEVYGHKLTDFVTPSPYLNKPSWTDETFHPKDVFNKDKMATLDTTTKTDNSGNEIEVNKMGYPIDKLDIRSNITPGNAKTWSEAKNMLSRFMNSPLAKNPNTYIEQNAAIDRFNAERGLVNASGNPISQHVIPHIADVLPDGTIVPNKKLSLPDFVYALTTPSHGAVTQETKLKKDASELQKVGEGIKKTEADIKHQKVGEGQENRKINETIRHNKAEEELARDKNDPDLAEANNAANTVLTHIRDTRSLAKFQPLDQAINKLPSAQADGITKTAAASGIDLKGYQVAPINSNDEVVRDISGIQYQNETGAYVKGVAKPEYAYYLKSNTGNPADDKYIIGYTTTQLSIDNKGIQKLGKNNKPQLEQHIEWKATTPQEAAGNVIKSRKNFDNITDKTTDNIGRAANKVAEGLGSTAPTSVSAVPQKTQVYNGKTYIQKDGKWYEQ